MSQITKESAKITQNKKEAGVENDHWLEEVLSSSDGDSFIEHFLTGESASHSSQDEFSVVQLDNVQEIRNKAHIQYNAGKYQDALKSIEDAIRILPGDLDLNYFQAQCLYQLGQLQRVEVILKNLMKMDESTEFIQLPRMLAFTLLKEDKFLEAEKFLKEAMVSYPDDLQIKHMYGVCCERQKNYPMAEAMFNQILNADPDHGNAHNSIAYILYLQNKDLHNASMHVQRALAHNPDNPAYLDTWGVLQAALGDKKAALETLQRAARLAPGNKVILAHINEVNR